MNLTLYVSLFLSYSFFIFVSLCQRRRWEEEERREVLSTVICNQGNGQSPSFCETVAPTHEAPMNTSMAILYCSNVAATWTLTTKEPFPIPGQPMHNTRPTKSHYDVLVSQSPPAIRQISFHQHSLLVFNSSSCGGTKVTSEATDPNRHTLISWQQWFQLCDWVSHPPCYGYPVYSYTLFYVLLPTLWSAGTSNTLGIQGQLIKRATVSVTEFM